MDEIYILCGRAEMRTPLDFRALEKNIERLEELLVNELMENINGFEDTTGKIVQKLIKTTVRINRE